MVETLSPEQEARAEKLHKESIVIDQLALDFVLDAPYVEQLMAGGVTAAHVCVAITDSFLVTMRKLEVAHRKIASNPNLLLATTAEDIRRAKREGKVAMPLMFQDAFPIEDDVNHVETFYKMGVRCIQLTYTGGNLLGMGCGERVDCGLMFHGLEVLAEMNRLGMLVDLSHTGDGTTADAIQHSQTPPIFTHTNSRTLSDTPRNKPDHLIQAMAKRGGLIGVVPLPRAVRKDRQPTIADLMDHVEHLARLVGPEHLGFGGDLTYGFQEQKITLPEVKVWRTRRPDVFGPLHEFQAAVYPKEIDHHRKFPNLTRALVRRGFPDDQIRGILGGNFLRVFEQICG